LKAEQKVTGLAKDDDRAPNLNEKFRQVVRRKDAMLIDFSDSKRFAEMNNDINQVRIEIHEILDILDPKKQTEGDDIGVEMIEFDIEDIKKDINEQLYNYDVKLDNHLQNASYSEAKKIKDYYQGFTQTFISVFVTGSIIEGNQVDSKTLSSKADVLSAIASFSPFIDPATASQIKSVVLFLKSKSVRSMAKRMMELAPDPISLSYIIGGSVYEIVTDNRKKDRIIAATEDLLAQS